MAIIYCFSATGNSLYVAKEIGKEINAKVEPMHKIGMSCEEEVIGFVFPTYFWGLPYQVERFILGLDIKSQNPYIFAVTTYGGAVMGLLDKVHNLLQKKGLHLDYGVKLKAVENYIPRYQVNDTDKMEAKVAKQLEPIKADIKEKKTSKLGKYTVINKVIYALFPAKKEDCDRYFNLSEQCNGCGICEKVCPVKNIVMEENSPQFLHHCEHCLACIHACPKVAIEWKKETVGRVRFRNRHISLKELIAFNHDDNQ